jgi:nucleoid DNA-binding protein
VLHHLECLAVGEDLLLGENMIKTTLATELLGTVRWIAQTPVAPGTTVTPGTPVVPPETTSVLFSGPQFFIALVSGVLLAFAFQLVLTNLSVAAGVSYLGHSSSSSDDDDNDSSGGGISVRKISMGVGIWTLITVTIALFAACFLAVQLSLLTTTALGAIVGLVIWAAYFSLLVWVSSTTVGSLIGSVVGAATSGFQALLGTATAAIGSRAAKQQMVSTAEAVTAAVRNELGSGIDPGRIRHSLEDYVGRLRLPSFDTSRIRQDFENLLNDPEIEALAQDDRLSQIDRQTFIDLISHRTDFTYDEVNRLADLLEGAWRQTIGQRRKTDSTADLAEYLRATQPGQLQIAELNAKLDRLLAEQQRQPQAKGDTNSTAGGGGVMQQPLQMGMNALIGLLMGRTDLSDLDLEKIIERLKNTSGQVAQQTDVVVHQLRGEPVEEEYSPVRADVENYLLNKPSWQMNQESIAREFREVIYDPDADPGAVANQLSRLNRSYFVELLQSRGLLTQEKIQRVADQLETIRREALSTARAAQEREIAIDLRDRVKTYLSFTPKEQLYSDDVLPGLKSLMEDRDADYNTLSHRLAPYKRAALQQALMQRQDISFEEAQPILDAIERTRDRVLFESQSLDQQAKQRYTDFQHRTADYLRNTGKGELDPERIKQDLQVLISDPQLGLSVLRSHASEFDRDTFVQILSQREDISEAEAQQLVDRMESNWHTLVHSPRILTDTVKETYDQTVNSIADYLRNTKLEELDPDGIQRDLSRLLSDPQQGTIALRRRLSQVDRETLVRLLSQRRDLTEEQANRLIDKMLEAIQQIIRAPRRLALRAKQQVLGFEASIEEYLRNTEKEELNPEGIERDLRWLLQDPNVGIRNLRDRISRFDRETLIALLAQRKDMTQQEAEQVVAQIESVRDRILSQMQEIQHRIQEIIDRIFARIRNYLNSLDRPELNYDSIKQDVQTMFDDPQASFDVLRNRLSQFDRNTLVAVLSSRKEISEADANRIVDQIESARNNVLQQAERIQTEAQRRLEMVKVQAQRQMEETRKAAETAAWWLFATALVSAVASAGAGSLAAF